MKDKIGNKQDIYGKYNNIISIFITQNMVQSVIKPLNNNARQSEAIMLLTNLS